MQIISPEECQKINPFVDVKGVIAGAWTLDDGHVDPSGCCNAMAIGARKLGATIIADFGVYAVNSLRMEKAYPGYGSELTTEITMIDANMERFVKFEKEHFVGKEALLKRKAEGSDCHNPGSGPLRTGEPVIVDIFPRNNATKYCGDCTRTVVHGEVSDEIRRMLDAVKEAKAAGIAAIRPGVTGETVHRIVAQVMEKNGYAMGLPKDDAPAAYCAMTHGTGHGVGLDVHEPPLLDMNGPELLVGDVVTVEPGLYSQAIGGVRLEDIVVVTPAGCEILNRLPEVLSW
jgi:Xaa-Pro aminopeptidase